MAILSAGSEADAFNLVAGSSYAHEATAGRFEATVSRLAMLVTSAASEIRHKFASPVGTFWTHVYLYLESPPGTSQDLILWETTAGTETPYKVIVNSDGTWTFQRYVSAAFVTIGTTAASVLNNAAGVLDFQIVRAASGGIFNVYLNGASIFTFTGNTNTDSLIGQLRFKGLVGASNEMNVSQIIIADEPTLGFKCVTLTPNANGANTAWTNDYTAIDEAVYDSADFIETNTVNAIETYGLSDIPAGLSTFNVKAVVVATRSSNDSGSTITDIQGAVRLAGVNYFSANMGLTKDGNEYSVQAVFNTNPATAAAWTQAEVNGAEAGLRAV